MLNPSVFHDYDIRGVYPTELDEEGYYRLGCALATYLNVDTIAVGKDMRVSSPSLFDALVDGITDMGTDVVDLGMISTEMQYFASGEYGYPANAVISASHNPPEYNGLKVVTKGAIPLHGNRGLPEIQELAIANNFEKAAQKGTITQRDILQPWIQHVLKFVDVSSIKPLRVVVDAGNGMGGITWTELAKHLPCEIIPLYFEPDGTFPNHHPDPLREDNLKHLHDKILSEGADMGIALDGDADRAFILDNKGELLPGTITTAMLAEEFLEKEPGCMILYNVNVGRIVPEVVEKHGGRSVRVRVGHSFIKQYMRDEGALFAGEHSGHFYFRENFMADSSAIAGLAVIEFLSKHDVPMSELAAKYTKYVHSGEINFRVKDVNGAIDQIKEAFSDARTDETDGVTFWYDDWWFIVRASKTEPLLRLNIEADNREILNNQKGRLLALMDEMGATMKK